MSLATISDDIVGLATLRYNEAYTLYRVLVDKNAELAMTGGKPSKQARREEERAFEELDCALDALLNAAAKAYPTIH
jgi:hypothetical protein